MALSLELRQSLSGDWSDDITLTSVFTKERSVLLSAQILGACLLDCHPDSAICWLQDFGQVTQSPCILISSFDNEFKSHQVVMRIKAVNKYI